MTVNYVWSVQSQQKLFSEKDFLDSAVFIVEKILATNFQIKNKMSAIYFNFILASVKLQLSKSLIQHQKNNKTQHFAVTCNQLLAQDGLPNILNLFHIIWAQINPVTFHKRLLNNVQIPLELKTIRLNPTQLMPHRKYCHLKRNIKTRSNITFLITVNKWKIVEFPAEKQTHTNPINTILM